MLKPYQIPTWEEGGGHEVLSLDEELLVFAKGECHFSLMVWPLVDKLYLQETLHTGVSDQYKFNSRILEERE